MIGEDMLGWMVQLMRVHHHSVSICVRERKVGVKMRGVGEGKGKMGRKKERCLAHTREGML